MRRIQPNELQSTSDARGTLPTALAREIRASTWAPARRALIPVDLPQRFIEGVAWDEV